MTIRDTYNTSVVAATAAKVPTKAANANAHQETIAASGKNVGYNNATGNFANFDAATRNANATYAAAQLNAEMIKQIAIQAAKDTLRATGDLAPA